MFYCVGKDCNPNQLPKDCFHRITFDGKIEKDVMPGGFFCTDPVEIQAEIGDFLCLEISFEGAEIPFHQEINIPTFVLENGKFLPHKKIPIPQIIDDTEKNAVSDSYPKRRFLVICRNVSVYKKSENLIIFNLCPIYENQIL